MAEAHNKGSGNQVIVTGQPGDSSGQQAQQALLTVLTTYTQGIQQRLDRQTVALIVLAFVSILEALLCVGITAYAMREMSAMSERAAKFAEQAASYTERANKRHWELSRHIELSQERSRNKQHVGNKRTASDGEAEATLP